MGNKTAAQRHKDLGLEQLGDEGFVIKTIGNDLVLAGGEKRGTLYGVYSFLETLGCRWWSDDASTIPDLKTIRVMAIDRRDVPKLQYRNLDFVEQLSANPWGIRNKVANFTVMQAPERWGGAGVSFHGGGLARACGRSKSLDYDHRSELWRAMGDGTRDKYRPCPSNPEVQKAVIDDAVETFRKYPQDLCLAVGQEEVFECQCKTCRATVQREGSEEAVALELANRVADRVAQEVPGKFVVVPAYNTGMKMPKTVRPRSNVIVWLYPREIDFGHPVATGVQATNVEFRSALDQWSGAARRVWVGDYVGNFSHYVMPHPNLDVLAANVKYCADHHATGYSARGNYACANAEFSRLRMWVLAHAMWNPEADGRSLVAEFCSGYYGSAGPGILKYIDAIHRPVRNNPMLYVQTTYDDDMPWLAAGVLAEAAGHLREAERKVAGNSVLEKRVRHASMPLWYVLALRGPSSRTWRVIESRLGPIRGTELAARLAKTIEEHNIPCLAEGDSPQRVKDFTDYLRDWSSRVGAETDLLPPELKGDFPRELQAYQRRPDRPTQVRLVERPDPGSGCEHGLDLDRQRPRLGSRVSLPGGRRFCAREAIHPAGPRQMPAAEEGRARVPLRGRRRRRLSCHPENSFQQGSDAGPIPGHRGRHPGVPTGPRRLVRLERRRKRGLPPLRNPFGLHLLVRGTAMKKCQGHQRRPQ